MHLPPYVEIILRSAIVYMAIFLALRIAGKRHLSQLSLLDFVLILLVSNAVQNAMVGNNTSLAGGLVAGVTLILLNGLITALALRSERLGTLIEGEASLLIWEGQVMESHMKHEGIRLDELEAAVREHGIEDISQVKLAVLEIDGAISVVGENGGVKVHNIQSRHRKRLGRRGFKPN
jgi:uncharacterized membrane protein YcaP (DUF421 family)